MSVMSPPHRVIPEHGPLGALTGHWQAWRRRDELDGLIIDGVEPNATGVLALRAHQLTERNHRCRLAAELRNIVAAVDGPDPSRYAVDVCADEVRVARTLMLELAALLTTESGCPRGVAIVRALLRDPVSPLYTPAPNDELWRRCRAARRAFDGA